jgi:hypothetical protein
VRLSEIEQWVERWSDDAQSADPAFWEPDHVEAFLKESRIGDVPLYIARDGSSCTGSPRPRVRSKVTSSTTSLVGISRSPLARGGAGVLRLRGTKTDGSDRLVPVVAFSVPLLEHALTYAEGQDGLLFRPWGNVRRDLAAPAPAQESRRSPRMTCAEPTPPRGVTTASPPTISPHCWGTETPGCRARLRAH